MRTETSPSLTHGSRTPTRLITCRRAVRSRAAAARTIFTRATQPRPSTPNTRPRRKRSTSGTVGT